MPYTVVGHQALTVSSSSVALTLTTPTSNSVTAAKITVETNAVRVRVDGTAPTASIGDPHLPGESFFIFGRANLTNFRAIRRDSADAVLQIVYLM